MNKDKEPLSVAHPDLVFNASGFKFNRYEIDIFKV